MKKLRILLIGCLFWLLGAISVQAASYSVAYEYDSLPYDTKTNCVAFVRYKVPSLPGGLYSLDDKKNIINSYTPSVGAVAISTGNSSYGHVAYVEAVSGSTITTLNGGFADGNGNYTGHIERISGTAAEQGIIGYWKPAGTSETVTISYTNLKTTSVTVTNANLYGDIQNPGRATISEVGVYIWDAAGNLVVDHKESCGLSYSVIQQQLDVTKEALPGGLNPWSYYTFQMYAVANGKEYKSSIASFWTKHLVPPRTVTMNKIKSGGYNHLKLSWNGVSPASGYAISRKDSKTGTFRLVKMIQGGSVTTWTDTINIKAGNVYYYRIRAFSELDGYKVYGNYSSTRSGKAVPAQATLYAINTQTKGTAKLHWNRIAGASGYEVYRALSPSGSYEKIKTISGGANTYYTHTKPVRGRMYYYKVRGYRTVNGKKVYGAFSSVRSGKIK